MRDQSLTTRNPRPYTPAALTEIRAAAGAGSTLQSVSASFGWSESMLERVCRQHGIDINKASVNFTQPVAQSTKAKQDASPVRAMVAPDDALHKFCAGLPPGQWRVMQALIEKPIGDLVYAINFGMNRNTLYQHFHRLNERLEDSKLPWRIGGRAGPAGGHYLVRIDSAAVIPSSTGGAS